MGLRLPLVLVLAFWCVLPPLAAQAPADIHAARKTFQAGSGPKKERKDRATAIDALVAARDVRGIEDLLGAAQKSEKELEKIRKEIETTGDKLKEAWKNVDRQNSAGRPVSVGTANGAQQEHKEIQDALARMTAEQDELEWWRDALYAGAGRLLAGVDPAARAEWVTACAAKIERAPASEQVDLLHALSACRSPDARDALIGILARAGSEAVRVGCIDALARLGDPAIAAGVAKSLKDDAWPVRVAAARALARAASADSIPALVAAFEGAEGRFLEEIIIALEDLAGRTFHDNATLWKQWWTTVEGSLRETMTALEGDDPPKEAGAIATAVKEGWLVAAAAMLRKEGFGPQGRVAPPSKEPVRQADAALSEQRRDAVTKILAAVQPPPLRDRSVRTLLLAPFGSEAELARRVTYLKLAAGVTSEMVRRLFDDVAGQNAMKDPATGKDYASGDREALRRAAKDGLNYQPKPETAGAGGGPKGPAPAEGKREGKGTNFYGIETRSEHIIFILDRSGSMNENDAKGGSRMEAARNEMVYAIRTLPENATFNIIFYNHDFEVWKKTMVQATSENKTAATNWVKAIDAVGATNIFDPLERAFELAGRGTHDKQYAVAVDTIFLMTDGQANRGRLINPEEMLKEVGRMNELKKVKIHTVGVGKDQDEGFLRKLAGLTGGTYVNR